MKKSNDEEYVTIPLFPRSFDAGETLMMKETEVWQCDNCHITKHTEKEVLCWECGNGEMIYRGKAWIAAEGEKYVPDNRSFLRRLIEFPFRLLFAND